MTRFSALAFISGLTLMARSAAPASAANPQPTFVNYPVTEIFNGAPAEPVLTSAMQRWYRTAIRQGVSKGIGVWTGSWRAPVKNSGPNFAGHYYVIRWGCGSNCLMMAIVDAQSGKVNNPPLSGVGTELYVPMDPMSGSEILFQSDSSLMILQNACKQGRRECGIYYFDWESDHFTLISRTLVDLAKVR